MDEHRLAVYEFMGLVVIVVGLLIILGAKR